jgi:hypothetical protein
MAFSKELFRSVEMAFITAFITNDIDINLMDVRTNAYCSSSTD